MELRRVGEAMLHSRLSPIAYFLTLPISTTSPRIWFPASPIASWRHQSLKGPPRRQFSTNKCLYQEPAVAPKPPPSSSSSSSEDRNLDLGALLDIQPKTTTPLQSSSSDLLLRYSAARGKGVPVERMLSPSNNLLDIIEEAPVPPREPTIRLNSTTGRSVLVNPGRGVDLGRAFKSLHFLCQANRIKQDSFTQRFHERPGLKRKRLKSARWRKKFMTGFRGMVSKVQEMKKKGW